MKVLGFGCWDIFFIVLAAYFIVRGVFRGFVGEVITLAGFIASFYLSFHYSGELGHIVASSAGYTSRRPSPRRSSGSR